MQYQLPKLTLGGCTSVMNKSGELRPCHREEDDAQALGNSVFNQQSEVIGKTHEDQPMTDVRAIMRYDIEKHRVEGSKESWDCVTDRNREMTWISFEEEVVNPITAVVARD